MLEPRAVRILHYDVTFDRDAHEGVKHLARFISLEDMDVLFRQARHGGEASFRDDFNRDFRLQYRHGGYHVVRQWSSGSPAPGSGSTVRSNPLR